MYEIRCTPGKVAIVLDPPEEMATSHLFRPDTAKGDNHLGTVLAVNHDGDDQDHLVQVNSRVVIPRYAGAPTTIDGREIHFMKTSDILAVVYPAEAPIGAHL
jgi:co-chaperonin GroES (HSP10)